MPLKGAEMTGLEPLLCASSMRKGVNMNINSVNNDMSTTILTNNVDLLHLFAPKMRKRVKVESNNYIVSIFYLYTSF
jgi:hypothetical protein